MDFEVSEEQEQLRASVAEVLARECPRSLARALAEGGETPAQPWRSAVELGWTGIAVPEAWGGHGLSFEELGLAVEEHGRALAPGPFLATTTWFAPLVREAGGDAAGARWLAAVARGARGHRRRPSDGRDGHPRLLRAAGEVPRRGERGREMRVVG